jgi:phenylpropionate dioxygenase-like ring-hydroxylating dioxygenase large terminal subunit
MLSRTSSLAMAGGLAVSYGTAGVIAGRYLYPSKPLEERWLYVSTVRKLAPGSSFPFRTPLGETVTIARQSEGETAEDFVALSSTCPHLGCQVSWEQANDRFFCPCHNGVFDPSGRATSGPPADAGQDLPEFPLKVEKGLLYIRVPVEGLA